MTFAEERTNSHSKIFKRPSDITAFVNEPLLTTPKEPVAVGSFPAIKFGVNLKAASESIGESWKGSTGAAFRHFGANEE